ncbi:hypothetical protein [Shimazuella kribbensis]|uniref:hypothetical protein n=1 Tax=Shimazuella kribbensis TaxID=139808 RepID=UPI000422D7DD|nr:hypothetical protein [Shimazuella kribbensis]
MSFTKRRILSMWGQEKKRLQYLLPMCENHIDTLTLGYQMIGRMKPILEQGYNEDHPSDHPYMLDILDWMEANGWNEMYLEFKALSNQVDEYIEAHQG